MIRKNKYLYLILGLILCAGIWRFDFFRGEETVERGRTEPDFSAWNQVIAGDANAQPPVLAVDGKEQNMEKPLYITGSLEPMAPVDAIAEAFSCAVDRYGNSRLVLQKGTVLLELKPGEAKMEAGGRPVKLKEPPARHGGTLYVPLEALEKGFSYSRSWDKAGGRIELTSQASGAEALPEAYDYRKEGRAPGVKNQGTLGTCWAFASLEALESTLLPEESVDFSEDHMSLNNGFCLTQDDGGEYTMSMAYLLSWRGPVLEKDDPYGDGASPEGLKPVKHVQEIQILPAKDYEKIKEAIYLYGGVQSSLYTSLKDNKSRSVYYSRENNAYCYTGTEKPNHDSVIIGWDDHYPKENFNVEVKGDGAFICTNSWGEEFGENGYFYVSYYDTNIGSHNILYTSVEDTDNYSRIYQTDLRGWVGQMGYGQESAYFANVYQAGERETLEAVGFYATGPGTEYEIYIVRRADETPDFSAREKAAAGSFSNAGYYTVPLDVLVSLEPGERYGVIVKITTPGAVHPVAIEYDPGDGRTKADIGDGEGYISLKGAAWERVEEEHGCNVCLKAYTAVQEGNKEQ